MTESAGTIRGKHVGRAVGDTGTRRGELIVLAGQAKVGLVDTGATGRSASRASTIAIGKGSVGAIVDTLAIAQDLARSTLGALDIRELTGRAKHVV